MTLLLLFLAAVGAGALLFSTAAAAFAWLTRRSDQDETDARFARYAEHLAAQNGRPHSEAFLSRATRRRS